MSLSFTRYGCSIPFMENKIESNMFLYCYTDILEFSYECDDCLGDCEFCPLEEELMENEL